MLPFLLLEPLLDRVDDSFSPTDHLRIPAGLLETGMSIDGEFSGLGKPPAISQRERQSEPRVGRFDHIALPLVIPNCLAVVGQRAAEVAQGKANVAQLLVVVR